MEPIYPQMLYVNREEYISEEDRGYLVTSESIDDIDSETEGVAVYELVGFKKLVITRKLE